MHARLSLLVGTDKGITESEIFRLALQQSVSELDALGGAIHLRGPMSALRLVSSAGLPPALTRSWEIVDQEGPTVPAGAVRRGRDVWVPTASPDAPGPPTRPWPGTGLASVPMFSGDRTIGALTLLMGDAAKPTEEQWEFLRSVVAWAEEWMGRAPPPAPPREELVGSRLRRALKAVTVGTWDWNIRTGELLLDEAAMGLYGHVGAPAGYVPRIESWMKVIHPDDLPWTLAAAERAIRDGTVYEAEYRVRRPDGSYGWTQSRGTVVEYDNGEAVRMVGMGWDSSESRTARDALSRALRHMSDGFLLVDDDWRITFANLEAERTIGVPEEELFGRVLWDLPAVRQVPDVEARCREAAATGTSEGFDVGIAAGRRHHLRLVPGPDGLTLYLTDVTEKRRREAEQAAAGRAASERAARITELTTALAKATTSQDVVDAVAQRVLPPFGASGLAVMAIEGDRAYVVGAVGYPQALLDTLDGHQVMASDPIADAIRTRAPLFVPSPEEYAERYPHLVHRPQLAGKQAWAFLPLIVSGRTFGVCSVAFDGPRHLSHEEQALLTAISALVAHALERARLYDAEHTRSQELQRGLLPRRLPELPVCTAAARYLPAGQGMDVGGDWYDVIPLSAGRVALVVGDVMGHGLSEAATMGRLRTAVKTLADLELPPDEIMSHLSDIVGGLGEDSYATCLYALYDSTSRICTIARAGHPPPAVVHPDGTVHFPELSPDPPLGAAEPLFETVELELPDESLLVLYTDGLVESPSREIDQGMAELARLLRTAGRGDLEPLCDTLTTGLLPAEPFAAHDDAALLVARVHALAADRMASWQLPEDPRAAGQAREHIRKQLSVWGLDDLTMTTELIVSELVGNVVRHAKGPVQLRLLRSASLVCEVSDGSLTTPRMRRASEMDEGGRGLQLVAALSQRWGTRYTAVGKSIWTEQTLSGPDGPPRNSAGAPPDLSWLQVAAA
ncbi:SpoIIE family protein phosphatase [Streptomyces sp. NY05-11A]|uniref:SpoIIE family protein phosphatase n=1 Tax=Streptomyces soliscabiei TaxID=588897 RepID=UPI0029BCE39A|nr:SpoIIE family protein phosphatase [Streptomyces sp. NY05-11A]MDX2683064.1 SpoIIE family protein phosphatase [Streptomyces sp. NY05-11A]